MVYRGIGFTTVIKICQLFHLQLFCKIYHKINLFYVDFNHSNHIRKLYSFHFCYHISYSNEAILLTLYVILYCISKRIYEKLSKEFLHLNKFVSIFMSIANLCYLYHNRYYIFIYSATYNL